MSQPNQLLLKKAYREICLGSSPFQMDGRTLYFKHLNVFDKIKCDEYGEKSLETAKRLGKKEEDEIIKEATLSGLWTKDDEKKIEKLTSDIRTMSKRKAESIHDEQIEQIEEIIEDYKLSLQEVVNKKNFLIKNSAESYSQHEYMINYIIESVYKDDKCEKQYWDNEEEKLHLDFRAISQFYHSYNIIFEKFSETNFRYIAIADYFQDAFSVVSDATSFFKKEVHSLSPYQIKLIRYGKYYKDILEESHDAPKEYRATPDLLEQWYILKRNRASNPEYEKQKNSLENVRNMFK
jgi:hypothetical protein